MVGFITGLSRTLLSTSIDIVLASNPDDDDVWKKCFSTLFFSVRNIICCLGTKFLFPKQDNRVVGRERETSIKANIA